MYIYGKRNNIYMNRVRIITIIITIRIIAKK